MEKLSVDEYVRLLRMHCKDIAENSLKILRSENINGRRAVRLRQTDFHNMKIPYGDCCDIIGFHEDVESGRIRVSLTLEETLPQNIPEPVEALPQNIPEPVEALPQNNYEPEEALPQNNPEVETSEFVTNSSRSSSESNSFDDDDYGEISEYFPKFDEMTKAELRPYLQQKKCYEIGLGKGLLLPLPAFMKKKKVKLSAKSKKSTCPPPHGSVQNWQQEGGEGSSGLGTRDSYSQDGSERLEGGERSSGLGSKDFSHEGSDDGTELMQCKDKKKGKSRKNIKKQENPKLSEEELLPTLPEYDVKAILKENGVKLQRVVKNLDEEGFVFDKERKLMVRTLTNHLYNKLVQDPLQVNRKMRQGMAASIVYQYPKFKDTSDPTKYSWFRFYDESKPSGYIQNCVASLQRHIPPEKRSRGGGSKDRSLKINTSEESDSEAPDDEFYDKNAEWMSTENPFDCSKKRIMEGMSASCQIRKNWIRTQNPFLYDVLVKYPHLMSYGGEALQQDFKILFPNNWTNFTREFPRFYKSVLTLESENLVAVPDLEGIDHDVIAVCLTIARLLPRPNLQRYRKGRSQGNSESLLPQLSSLIHIIPRNVNIRDEVAAIRAAAQGKPVQPFLIGLAPSKAITKLYVVVDSKFIELETTSIIKGLDMLFQSYQVFYCQYPLGWKIFWEFIEHGIYRIEPGRLINSGKELLDKIKHQSK